MNLDQKIKIRGAEKHEHRPLGDLMVRVYSNLQGFPKPHDQPGYYDMLRNIGALTSSPGTELLVAVGSHQRLLGGVVYFNDMKYYGSGGTAPQEKAAAGFRLLAVDPDARGKGVGRALSQACIDKARQQNRSQVIIHTTEAMQVAWGMYRRLGFVRSEDLDFMQQDLPVFGFRLGL